MLTLYLLVLHVNYTHPYTRGSLYRVTAQSHVKAERAGGGDSDATHFSLKDPRGGLSLYNVAGAGVFHYLTCRLEVSIFALC